MTWRVRFNRADYPQKLYKIRVDTKFLDCHESRSAALMMLQTERFTSRKKAEEARAIHQAWLITGESLVVEEEFSS